MGGWQLNEDIEGPQPGRLVWGCFITISASNTGHQKWLRVTRVGRGRAPALTDTWRFAGQPVEAEMLEQVIDLVGLHLINFCVARWGVQESLELDG